MISVRTCAFALVSLFAASGHTPAVAETATADKAACFESNDGAACQREYVRLHKVMKATEGKKAEAFYPELVALADFGCSIANRWLCAEVAGAYGIGSLGRPRDDVLSLEFYTKACDLDNAFACAKQGLATELGQGVAADRQAAMPLYQKSCTLRSDVGCKYAAAWLLMTRVYSEPAPAASIATLQRMCADTDLDGPSCVKLGAAYIRGQNVEKNFDEAKKYWNLGCSRAVYGPACYLASLNTLRTSDMSDLDSSENYTSLRKLAHSCDLGVEEACDFLVFAGQKFAWDDAEIVLRGRYGRCLDKPSREDCEFAGDAYKIATVQGSKGPQKIRYEPGRIALAWLTACRNFNTRCVEAADEHLRGPVLTFSIAAPNLAIGILQTACERGDAASCTRKDEVIAETSGVTGSYIDPMISDDERFILARFDLQRGDTQRGRETMQWLATMDYTSAQIELANAYRSGLATMPRNADGSIPDDTLFDRTKMTWKLYEILATKGIPEAAMQVAVRKYQGYDDNYDKVSYEAAIYRALYLGAEGAVELDAAQRAQDKARTDARIAAIQEMNRQNIQSRDNMDRQTVQSAWNQYYKRQDERKEAEGGEVCGTVYGEGNSTYRTCMSRATAMKHYRGNF